MLFRLVVIPLTNVAIYHATILIDEIEGRPEAVSVGIPDTEVIIDRYRPGDLVTVDG